MTLKELRIWHWREMNRHGSMARVAAEGDEAIHRGLSNFHRTAVVAINDTIGGSVEQDIADAEKIKGVNHDLIAVGDTKEGVGK